MGKARRKNRLVYVREPNGRLSRAGKPKEFAPAEIRRLREAALIGMRDAHWGTELGRLFLTAAISEEMYAVGRWWGEMAAKYQSAINAPVPFPKSASLDIGRGNQSADPDSEAGQLEAKRHRGAALTFLEAHAALLGAGMLAERAVRRLCEENVPLSGAEELESARRGLLWVAKHRGLTEQRK